MTASTTTWRFSWITMLVGLAPTVVLFLVSGGQATKPSVAKKDISLDCKVEPAPVMGELFTITMRFTLDERTRYVSDQWAGSSASLGMWPQQEYVSGDTVLQGRFRDGEVYELSATYRTIRPGPWTAGVLVKTWGETDSPMPTSTTVSGCSHVITDPNVPPSEIYDSVTGLRVRRYTSGDIPMPPVGRVEFTETPVAQASKPYVAKKDISLECQVEPTPVLGELFTITMRFTINEPTNYLNEPWAGATAMLGMRPRQEFVSGDTILVEKFVPGQVYEMSAVYRTVRPGSFSAGIQVRTYGEADASGNPKTNGTGSTVTLLTGCQVRIADPNDRSGQLIVDPKSGVSYRQVMTGDSVFGHISPGSLKVEAADRADQTDNLAGASTVANPVDERQPPIATTFLKLRCGRDCTQVDTIAVPNYRPSRFGFFDVDKREELFVSELELKSGVGALSRGDDDHWLYTPAGFDEVIELIGDSNGRRVRVILKIGSLLQ